MNSVNKYKGYYIARYEAGILTKITSYTYESDVKPIFQATSDLQKVYAYNYIRRDLAQNLSKNLYKKESDNINSILITSKGWDTALNFIATVGDDKDESYPINSIGKGWYSDNQVNNSEHETGKSIDETNNTTPNKLKNIYDMGGNVSEWTLENCNIRVPDIPCMSRGGNFTDNALEYSAGNRFVHSSYINMNYPNNWEVRGFRVMLYL